MKKLSTFFYTLLIAQSLFGQKSPTDKAQPIVEEGKKLYRLEMASWIGTDMFLEVYNNQDKIGGYFSFEDENRTKCIFYTRDETPMVIGSISFDSTFEKQNTRTDLRERSFTAYEKSLYKIRKIAVDQMTANEDMFYTFYQNTSPNFIPIIEGQERKVYILTGPQESGVVLFGNDYLLTFNENNELKTRRKLHANLIPIQIESLEGQEITEAMHSHTNSTGEFITATDICTLMLYAPYTNWEQHTVVSKKYMNIWNCKKNELLVLPMKTIKKINRKKEDLKEEKNESESDFIVPR